MRAFDDVRTRVGGLRATRLEQPEPSVRKSEFMR
jgi:hypothetical protein